jgi:hypothetical protein
MVACGRRVRWRISVVALGGSVLAGSDVADAT